MSITLRRKPWLHWTFVYTFGLAFFFAYRCLALEALVHTYGSKEENTLRTKLSGILLGACEDFVCVTYLVLPLWTFDCYANQSSSVRSKTGMRVARFLVYWLLFLVFTIPFVANGLLVRIRQMRFTLKFIEMYINEKDAASGLEVSSHERNESYHTIAITAIVSLLFSACAATWIDLSQWNVTHLLFSTCAKKADDAVDSKFSASSKCHQYTKLELGEDSESYTGQGKDSSLHSPTYIVINRTKRPYRPERIRTLVGLLVLVFFVAILPMVLLQFVQHYVAPVVAMVGLNTTLSDIFRLISGEEFIRETADGKLDSAAYYLDSNTEEYTLFKDDALYRRTTGFKGDLAFNVTVDPANLPNVLVIVVESFRYHDSQYLVANNTYLLNDKDITVTPHFDRWAKRGIAFRNLWSGWQTSRSLESILFAQLPYASVTESGTTTGRTDVQLSGMPQFFKAKGYEATFTTGCRTDYDQWDKFLPSHGFDDVLDVKDFKRLAERDLGIDETDWALKDRGGKARGMSYWGIHDDVAFEVLANIVTNKTREQQARMDRDEPKKPFFVNHYTISSHFPYEDRPEWYDNYTKPDFSALYENQTYSDYVRNYLEMRYFQDLALGRFLDRMDKHGVLKDTIVLVVGDHGQGPEYGRIAPEYREISSTRVAATLIAEGRLGKYAGMLVDDAAEHYDLLNTMMDIVGVAEGGFVQDGVGRSLKRKTAVSDRGDRVVWSNNPVRRMSVVRGHKRLRYDVMTSSVSLHDTDKDNDMKHDLFPELSAEEQKEWMELRDAGRKVSAYYKRRWKKNCLLQTEC